MLTNIRNSFPQNRPSHPAPARDLTRLLPLLPRMEGEEIFWGGREADTAVLFLGTVRRSLPNQLIAVGWPDVCCVVSSCDTPTHYLRCAVSCPERNERETIHR